LPSRRISTETAAANSPLRTPYPANLNGNCSNEQLLLSALPGESQLKLQQRTASVERLTRRISIETAATNKPAACAALSAGCQGRGKRDKKQHTRRIVEFNVVAATKQPPCWAAVPNSMLVAEC
jgi:hypothetical protein